MINFIILQPIFWVVKSILTYFLIVLLLNVGHRSYKIISGRANRLPISGKNAILVTGATSGIGLAVSKHLYKLGYSVFVGYYDSSEPGYAELLKIKEQRDRMNIDDKYSQRMIFIELDVRDQQSISEAYDKCDQSLRDNKLELFALINNAGLGLLQPFAWTQRRWIKDIVETNLMGTLMMTREFLPLLTESRGRVINVSSGLGMIPGETYATYGLTKSAQIYFTRCMNRELSNRYGVRSIAILPHNFIKLTNISCRNVSAAECAWSELKQVEKQLYEKEFEQHLRKLKQLSEATTTQARLLDQHRQTATRSNGGSHDKNEAAASISFRSITRWLMGLIECLKGVNRASTIEDSGVLESFEDALRSKSPPECLFAGDKIYNFIVGPLVLSYPSSWLSFMGALVLPSLYR